jgi:hypothetical protein
VCGRNLITGLTSVASPRVDISSTCKVGQKFGVSLPLLTCSPSAWPSRLLYRRGRKFRWDLNYPVFPGDLTIRRKNYMDVCHQEFSPEFIVFVNEVWNTHSCYCDISSKLHSVWLNTVHKRRSLEWQCKWEADRMKLYVESVGRDGNCFDRSGSSF